jgi:hypothetical protein
MMQNGFTRIQMNAGSCFNFELKIVFLAETPSAQSIVGFATIAIPSSILSDVSSYAVA